MYMTLFLEQISFQWRPCWLHSSSSWSQPSIILDVGHVTMAMWWRTFKWHERHLDLDILDYDRSEAMILTLLNSAKKERIIFTLCSDSNKSNESDSNERNSNERNSSRMRADGQFTCFFSFVGSDASSGLKVSQQQKMRNVHIANCWTGNLHLVATLWGTPVQSIAIEYNKSAKNSTSLWSL